MSDRRAPSGTIAYEDTGTGTPLVLLHAFPLAKEMWRPQREALASICRVIAPDLRGFGGSDLNGTLSVESMADDVAALLDALSIREPVVLGGLSMGGYVALAFAHRHAGRLRGLILADTKADPDDDEAKANRNRMIAFASASGDRTVIDQLVPKLVGADTTAHRPAVIAEIRALASAQSRSALVAALKALRDRPDATPGLRDVAVPTLVLVGEQDGVTPPAKATALAQAIRGAEVVVIPGAGHLANLEQPEAFNAAVRGFLERLRA